MKQPIKNFTQAPNEIKQLYMKLPNFKVEHFGLYIILRDYYNADKGYAYPTYYTLALDTGSSVDRVEKMLTVLAEYNLIKKHREGYGNYRYTFPDIIETEDELYKQYPQAREAFIKQLTAITKRKDCSRYDKERYLAEISRMETQIKGLDVVKRQLNIDGGKATVQVKEVTQGTAIDTSWF